MGPTMLRIAALGTALNIGSILSRNAGAVKKRKRLQREEITKFGSG